MTLKERLNEWTTCMSSTLLFMTIRLKLSELDCDSEFNHMNEHVSCKYDVSTSIWRNMASPTDLMGANLTQLELFHQL